MISDATLRRLIRSDSTVALIGDLVRGLLGIAALTALAWWLQYYAALVRVMYVTLHMNDFGKFYYSARAFLEGGDMYGPNPATAIPVGPGVTWQLGNMNPPHFHVLLLPLARLQPLPAYLLWAAASVLALALSLQLIARTLDIRWTWTAAAWTLVGVIVAAATGTTVVTGQVSFLMALPMTLAWVDARGGRWVRAAAVLGVLASIKPFLGVFGLYFLVTRRFKAARIMTLAAALCFAAGWVVFGGEAYAAWVRVLGGVDWSWAVMNGSVSGLVTRAFVNNPFFTPIVQAPRAAAVIATLAALSVLAATLVATARDRSPRATDRAFALLILAALLASPLGWVYYLWFAAGPLASLVRTMAARPSASRNRLWVAALPGIVCPAYLTLAGQQWIWGAVTLGSIYTWSMLALWGGVLCDWGAREADGPYFSGAK